MRPLCLDNIFFYWHRSRPGILKTEIKYVSPKKKCLQSTQRPQKQTTCLKVRYVFCELKVSGGLLELVAESPNLFIEISVHWKIRLLPCQHDVTWKNLFCLYSYVLLKCVVGTSHHLLSPIVILLRSVSNSETAVYVHKTFNL